MSKNWVSLLFWIALCLLIGFAGSFFNPGEWYAEMEKPALTPPNIIFPIVWNVLFILMGFAAWRVWCKRNQGVLLALGLFFIQLGLNILWSYLFFGIHRPELALIEIIFLWFAILITSLVFYKIDHLAGFLLLPYLVWVSFASYLNYAFVQLNNF
ncbi:MAG: TspO/MBR family protein [Pseudomonadota bacterium]